MYSIHTNRKAIVLASAPRQRIVQARNLEDVGMCREKSKMTTAVSGKEAPVLLDEYRDLSNVLCQLSSFQDKALDCTEFYESRRHPVHQCFYQCKGEKGQHAPVGKEALSILSCIGMRNSQIRVFFHSLPLRQGSIG